MGNTVVITSGKGGVGKTTVTASLGLALASRGVNTLLIDGDVGLNNLDVALGMENRAAYDMADVMAGKCRVSQAILQVPGYPLYIMPSAHAVYSEQIKAGDFRARTGMQDFVGSAPLNLLFVADLSKTSITSNESRWLCLGADAGLMSQNVYLYCTSVGLSTVLRGSVDAAALGPLLGLGENERIIFAQSVGYPPAP